MENFGAIYSKDKLVLLRYSKIYNNAILIYKIKTPDWKEKLYLRTHNGILMVASSYIRFFLYISLIISRWWPFLPLCYFSNGQQLYIRMHFYFLFPPPIMQYTYNYSSSIVLPVRDSSIENAQCSVYQVATR